MTDNILFLLMGGLGFFFFGMKTMSEGLKKIAGENLKNFLHRVTKHRLAGILVGTFVTCLIQSSSATTVMVVGFVNAGLLSLLQAIPVIMGANIGTTITAWLVSSISVFKITSYALPSVCIGFLIMTIAKSRKRKSLGEVILGFGLLFVGLHFMKDASAPLKESAFIKEVFTSFSVNPLLGVLAGIVFTAILQSSSATIAIVQVLAFNGVVPFAAAIPLVLGDNIGTTVTAQMAAMGTNLNARRAAMSHTVFNVIGTLYMLPFVYFGWFEDFINWIIPGEVTPINIMVAIAIANTVIKVVNTIAFTPFTKTLERVSIWLVPQKADAIDYGTQYLEKHLLETPAVALEQIHKETRYMLSIANKGLNHAKTFFKEKDYGKGEKACELETVTDNLQAEITQYIVELSQKELLAAESQEIPVLIHNVNDIERIGDHIQNIVELTRRKFENKLKIPNLVLDELNIIWKLIDEMFHEANEALKSNNLIIATKVLEKEGQVNQLQEQFKQNYAIRVSEGKGSLNTSFVLIELVDNLEKIGDRLTNIAQSVLIKMQWKMHKEDYLIND